MIYALCRKMLHSKTDESREGVVTRFTTNVAYLSATRQFDRWRDNP